MTDKWHWIEPSPAGGVGGDTFGKVFRSQGYSSADLLAREALQNSWDAALRGGIDFRFESAFTNIKDEDFREFASTLGIDELMKRRSKLESTVTFPDESAMEQAVADRSITVLKISDYGTTGLSGHPREKFDSRLFRALYTLGSTQKNASSSGQGGSFGFGKSALISASSWRSVIAYTRFQPLREDAASSRLIGWTYWTDHRVDGKSFEGRAIFGEHDGADLPVPFEDQTADELAMSLGFPMRSRNAEDFGTTFMLIAPNVNAQDLLASIERYWWPALTDHVMSVTVQDSEGYVHYPKPKQNPSLKPFIRAYELAVGGREPRDSATEVVPSAKWKKKDGKKHGALALVVDPDQEPLESQQDEAVGDWHNPTVALMRRPRMVIEYRNFSSTHPIRGVFVADDDVDEVLRRVEPPLHDSWSKLLDDGISPVDREHAKSINFKIKKEVKAFALKFAPVARVEGNTFEHLGRILGDALFGNSTGGISKPSKAPSGTRTPRCEIRLLDQQNSSANDDGTLMVMQAFQVQLPKDLAGQSVDLLITSNVFVCEDLDDVKGNEVASSIAVQGQPAGNGDVVTVHGHEASDLLKFEITVPQTRSHHKLNWAPKVEVRPVGQS